MGSRRNNTTGETASEGKRSVRESATVDENVRAIKRWERNILLRRSKAEQISDWIATTAASGTVLFLHAIWFAAWVTVNAGWFEGIAPFDPFPFPFLTMVVSLEAIFLALFVLASQNRMSVQADKRSHLDLQIDLLAEREMTAVLQLLQDIAVHLKAPTSVTPEQLHDLMQKTDIRGLTKRMEELAETMSQDPRTARAQAPKTSRPQDLMPS